MQLKIADDYFGKSHVYSSSSRYKNEKIESKEEKKKETLKNFHPKIFWRRASHNRNQNANKYHRKSFRNHTNYFVADDEFNKTKTIKWNKQS